MVITNVNQVVYQGDGVTTAFPFTFRIIDDTDIKLLLLDSDGTETDITSDYYVDTVNNTVHYPGYAPGTEPALSDRPPVLAEGQKLAIYRELPITQEKDLGDKWPFYVIELALDKLTMILQQIFDWWGRTLKVSQGATVDGFNPDINPKANEVITVNADGDGFECREALMEVNGAWDGEGRQIKGVAEPTDNQDAVTKNYVVTLTDNNFMKLQPDGTAWEGRNLPIGNVAGPALVKDAANKDYVDRILAGYSGQGDRFVFFDNVAQMQAAELVPSQMAVTLGYHDVNDGGAGVYTIRDKGADTPDGGSIIEIPGTDYVAELITDGTVNVKQFGAKGDGVTDDTAVLQNANVSGFKKILFPKGIYIISESIEIQSNIIIFGDGATIKRRIGYSVFDMLVLNNKENISLTGISIDGSAAEDDLSMAVSAHRFNGIKINGCNNCKLNHVEVINTCSAEIQPEGTKSAVLVNDSTSIDFVDCVVENNRATGFLFYGSSSFCRIIRGHGKNNYGSAISGGCNSLMVESFVATNNGYSGISLNGKNNICIGCISNNNGNNNPYVAGKFSGFTLGHRGNDAENAILSDCISYGNSLDGISCGGGKHMKVSNCSIYGNQREGIYCGGITLEQYDVDILIDNCIVTSNVIGQIRANLNSNVKISDCNIKGNNPVYSENATIEVSESYIEVEKDDYSTPFALIQCANSIINIFDNKFYAPVDASNPNGRCVLCSAIPSTGRVDNNTFNGFRYLLYEAVSGCDIDVSIPSKSKRISSDDNAEHLLLTLTSDLDLRIYTQQDAGTHTYTLTPPFIFSGSVDFMGSNGNAIASYSAATQKITVTTSVYSYINGSAPALKNYILRA